MAEFGSFLKIKDYMKKQHLFEEIWEDALQDILDVIEEGESTGYVDKIISGKFVKCLQLISQMYQDCTL